MKEMKLQLFADGTANSSANGTNEPNSEANNTGNGTADGNKQTYTQEDLDRIVNERSERASKSALKSFFTQQGLTEEEANSAFEDYKKNKSAKEEALKNDAKAQAQRADEAEMRANERIALANDRIIKSSAKSHAMNLGVKANKLDFVIKMADLSKIAIDDDGIPDESAIKASIEEVLKAIPEFKETKESSGFKIGADGNKEDSSNDDAIRKAFGLPSKKK